MVLHVGGLHWATSGGVVESVLGRRPGVLAVAANAANQTATVTYDPAQTSVDALSGWVRNCDLHCAGQSVPNHLCDPMAEPGQHAAHGAATPQEMRLCCPIRGSLTAGERWSVSSEGEHG